MKITIESTTKIVELNNVPSRIWEGRTATGIPVHCYITRIAVAKSENVSEFEQELRECVAPSPAVEAIPLRMIL